MDAENRLTLILVGLSELDRRLAMSQHESFRQRLIVRHQVDALSTEEIESYITHRIALAGVPKKRPLFNPQAMEAIRLGSKGLPPTGQSPRPLLAPGRRPAERSTGHL